MPRCARPPGRRAGPRARLLAACVLAAALAPAPAAGTGPEYDRALRRSQAVLGQPVGDYAFRDAQGQPVRLDAFRGAPLVVSFVYTGCFQACPVATRFLADAVEAAHKALGPDAFQVLTIGFNQPFDGPEAMAAFARRHGIDDPRWRFVAPRAEDVEALAAAFGFSFAPTPKGFDHVTQATIVDADGVVYRQVYGETFELPLLVGPLKELLSGQATRAPALEGLWTRVKLYCTVYDPVAGRYRLDYSLFFELFAGASVLGAIAWFLLRELRRARRNAA